MTDKNQIDIEKTGKFAERVFGHLAGALVSGMIHLGERMGLYQAMNGAGPLTSEELARKTVRWVEDPLLGRVAIPAVPVKFSAWPDRTELRSARLGEDNERVLRDYLGLSDDRIRELYANGTLVRDKGIPLSADEVF